MQRNVVYNKNSSKTFPFSGVLIHWGKMGNDTYGLIEKPGGSIDMVFPTDIKFCAPSQTNDPYYQYPLLPNDILASVGGGYNHAEEERHD